MATNTNSEDSRDIFQKIIDGDIPSERVYEDEHFLAFRDIEPKAPVHFLVVPKEHSPRLDEMLDAQGKEGGWGALRSGGQGGAGE